MKIYSEQAIRNIIAQAKAEVTSTKVIDNQLNDVAIEKLDLDREACGCYFNFKDPNFKVFSVEREKLNTRDEVTSIAYTTLKPDNTVLRAEDGSTVLRTWFFFCSRKMHNEIVNQYKTHVST